MNRKVALVTGSGRRLGRQIALNLAEHGFDLVIHYNKSEQGALDTAAAIKRLGGRCISLPADLTDSNQINALVEIAMTNFLQIDVLVNNAGVYSRESWDRITYKQWQSVLQVNLSGTFLVTQAVGKRMVDFGGGRIINIASIGGIQSWPHHLPYSVSKSGVVTLTRTFARALAPSVLVNAIAPGTIIIEGEEDAGIGHIPVNKIPIGRYGRPTDITSTVVYLATAASYVSGQIFPIDGGRSVDLLAS